ncbi:MAG: hypothetical protein ACRDSZ_12550 [Pseudonocardiaceae bacterium]
MLVLSGLSRLLRLLPVVVVLVVVALGVQQAIVHAESVGDLLDFGPFRQERQIIQEVSGPPPWTVEGYGYRYSVESITRTSHRKKFQPQPSLTITGFVTQTEVSRFSSKEFQIHDHDGNLLDYAPFEGNGNGGPPLNQRAKLVIVVWDANPSAQLLTITIHDFCWPAERDLVRQIVPSRSATSSN